jgi:hypothetical protein
MASADVPTCEELLETLRTRGMPADGVDALAFTLPGTGEGAPRITARPASAEDATTAVPADVMEAIEQHVLSCCEYVHFASATEADLAAFSTARVYPADFPAVILYIYPLAQDKGTDWAYKTPAPEGLSVRDLARCITATYRVILEEAESESL